jgi:hypothetical protein
MERNDTKQLSWKAGLVAGVLLALSPAAAWAQVTASGTAHATLYEVMEAPPPRPSTGGLAGVFIPGPGGSVTRLAQATESGTVGAADGSLAAWSDGQMEAQAQSRVDLFTGSGPFAAIFSIDGQANGKTVGKAKGTLNLSPMLDPVNPLPLAFLLATWSTLGAPSTRQSGSVEGVVYLPFACGGTACYLGLDGLPTPLAPNEFKDGVPLVKFVLDYAAQ